MKGGKKMSYNRYETERLIRESEEFGRYLDSLQREGERLLESMRRHGIEINHREPEAFNEKLKRERAI